MYRIIFCAMALLAASIDVRAEDAKGVNLDVAGIRIGMGVKEAMGALKAENPKFFIQAPTRQLEGFSAPLHSIVTGEQAIGSDNDGEYITLLFTMPPSRELVWGIRRIYNFRAGKRPTTDNTLAALRAKYGPENIPATNPRTQNLMWVFDEKGQLLPADKAKQLDMSCATLV